MRRSHRLRTLAGLGIIFPALLLCLACSDVASQDEGANPAGAENEDPRAEPANEFAKEGDSGVVPPSTMGASRREGNGRPVVSSVRFEPEQPQPGASVRAMAEASDPEGDPIELSYTWRRNGERLRASTESLSLADARKGDTLEVTVSAGDGRAVGAPYSLSIQLANRAPQVKSVRLVPDDGVPPRGRLRVVAEASDPDEDAFELDYTWMVNGNTVSGNGVELQKPVGSGDWVSVRVVANDGEAEGRPFELPEVEIANAAPWIVSQPGAPGPDGVFHYRVSAEDFDRHRPFRFSLEDSPEGMTVDERRGLVEWTPNAEQSGRHRIEIVVHDSRGAPGRQIFELVVGDDEAAAPPAARQGS